MPAEVLTEAEIRDLQASLFADDVELLLPAMLSWTRADVEAYFESEGTYRPGESSMLAQLSSGPGKFVVAYAPRIAVRKECSAESGVVRALSVLDQDPLPRHQL